MTEITELSNLTEDMPNTKEVLLNLGPQHPSTHGVLRLVLELKGEIVERVDPHIGYLHRGTEKLAESFTYTQIFPLTDRLDYLCPPSNNLAFAPRRPRRRRQWQKTACRRSRGWWARIGHSPNRQAPERRQPGRPQRGSEGTHRLSISFLILL